MTDLARVELAARRTERWLRRDIPVAGHTLMAAMLFRTFADELLRIQLEKDPDDETA